MSRLILSLILLSGVFLFSLVPNTRAQTLCEGCFIPTAVVFVYVCQLDCPSCLEGDSQCKACDGLEMAFPNQFFQNRCSPPCGPFGEPIIDCEQGPVL